MENRETGHKQIPMIIHSGTFTFALASYLLKHTTIFSSAPLTKGLVFSRPGPVLKQYP